MLIRSTGVELLPEHPKAHELYTFHSMTVLSGVLLVFPPSQHLEVPNATTLQLLDKNTRYNTQTTSRRPGTHDNKFYHQ